MENGFGNDNVQFELRFYAEDNVVFYEGEYGDCLYDIVKGSVYVFKNYQKPGQRLLAQLFPGDYFGELAILEAMPRNATIVAACDDTMLRLIRDRNFGAYAAQNPDKALRIMHSMGASYKALTQKYNDAVDVIYEMDATRRAKARESESLKKRRQPFIEAYEARHPKLPEDI